MRRIALALALAAFAAGASAQPLTQQNLTGNECWQAAIGGPGGQGITICSSTIRNARDVSIVSGSGTVATTATNLTSTLMWTGAAPTAWNITLPATPADGQLITVGTDTTLTTMVTVTAPAGQTLAAAYTSQTVTAGQSAQWQYEAPLTKWFRIR